MDTERRYRKKQACIIAFPLHSQREDLSAEALRYTAITTHKKECSVSFAERFFIQKSIKKDKNIIMGIYNSLIFCYIKIKEMKL